MSINEQIEGILDKRLGRGLHAGNGRLQDVEIRINMLNSVKEKLEAFDMLIAQVLNEIKEQRGSYYQILSSDPEAKMQFDEIIRLRDIPLRLKNGDLGYKLRAIEKIDKAIKELERLYDRFKREAIRIAFIGVERQGKSTFIKTITGLNDKVIPAYGGNSCTGAVSVIHNVDHISDSHGNPMNVKVDVDYYTEKDFVEMVNSKLKKFFPGEGREIRILDQIGSLNLPEYAPGNLSATLSAEYDKFKDAVVDHFQDYRSLIGAGKHTYYDENVIAQHVAQYEEFDCQVPGSHLNSERGKWVLNYYKYVAVKDVNIYTKFKIETTRKLELVDTIGIGSASDSDAIKAEMIRVLREDCDAAINLFRPNVTPDYPKEQTELIDHIYNELSGRHPSKWMVYILNKRNDNVINNYCAVPEVLNKVNKILAGKKQEEPPVAWVKAIDGSKFDDVKDELVYPLLEILANNLDQLDEGLMNKANQLGMEAYNECISLVRCANLVTTASIGTNPNVLSLFNNVLFPNLNRDFGRALNELDDKGYKLRRDEECLALKEAYEKIIDNLFAYVPNKFAIEDEFLKGGMLAPVMVFMDYVEQMRNDILNAFEDVNITVLRPLQEKVKSDLAQLLYDKGLMKRLPSKKDTADMEWLQDIVDNYVAEQTYPSLYKAIHFILDYQINIEGMVEYYVTESLYIIDRTHELFMNYMGPNPMGFEDKADAVWQELCTRISPLQDRLRNWIGSFTKIPSRSFYSRVYKFHAKMATDQNGLEDFRNFYTNNMPTVWPEEIAAACAAHKAFGEWSSRVQDLQRVVTRKEFSI